MFITLSFSDICVGLLSVPTIFLTLFTQNLDVLCMIFSIMKFFLYLPYGFSWFMIIIITIDRVLLITKGHIYKTHITMKVIYSITVFSILLNLAVATLVDNGSKVFERVPSLVDVLSSCSWNFLHYHHRCSIYILILVCSLKVKSDSECTTWSNKFWHEICDECNLYLHMLVAVHVTLSCHRRRQVQCPNIGSSARKKLKILGVYHTVFKFICKCMDNSLSES